MLFHLHLQAITARDSMAKSLYSALFDWIVLRINHALLNKKDMEESVTVSFSQEWVSTASCVLGALRESYRWRGQVSGTGFDSSEVPDKFLDNI